MDIDYHSAQREAVETAVWFREVRQVRDKRKDSLVVEVETLIPIPTLLEEASERLQADYLATLAEPAEAYESANHESLPTLPPHEFLAAHLENIGMTATEWGKLIGIDRSTASRLLRGERKFDTGHVRKTAEALGLEIIHLI